MAYAWAGARRIGLAIIVAACPLNAAFAEDDEEDSEPSPISMVIFGSMETGPRKTFASIGMKRAIGSGGLARDGWRLFLKTGASQEPTRRMRPRGTTYKAESQAMLGYEWRIGDSFVALYAGSDTESVQHRRPFGVTVTPTRYGGRIQADLWSTPMDGMMVQAGAYVSSLGGRFWARAATGWQLPASIPIGSRVYVGPQFYIGPEIEAYRENGYSKLRAGLHLTGLRALGVEWRVSAGWQQSSAKASEAYATIGAHWLR
ncbi:cellulose biosynthesis protein BcsS [Bosea sp. (in: a-proteobacteria)]|nr:cellulose biosynthesis protein BcsS [Bosea sp. (in: a-proteobacteria)]TAJ31373.1 MAG: cellulose biosynthesis protein BcsS [Bosea sp. (in: a-proteobacteria)]SIQ79728.1 Cellulose biosynthesis protein BcsS [Bosea sp. TND4EK4]